ncbi:tubulin---tyrosine ligase [Trypanosoma rangeli]|uniref:Tubulin--tyrosine ligase n=1 Tax=Trypanosoma rangeli TaxID=5698 RepID=A0A422NZN7_TRYRA|nr:tubulin---tyrosine ligase [Trypanosoma rangeli]RNF10972.1 tubulin---tyrosine ligase [Trypanosoma rangeli]|eukprot:RNF10972.1 tubulin---tyrosine ligase [Trypanosoma rangeli]
MTLPHELSSRSTISRTSFRGSGVPPTEFVSPPCIVKVHPFRAAAGNGGKREENGDTLAAPSLSLRTTSAARDTSSGLIVEQHPRLLAVMENIGSFYKEMTRQLMSTGEWVSILVMRSWTGKELVVAPYGTPLRLEHVALFLSEKIPAEKFIESRRLLAERDNKHHGIRHTRDVGGAINVDMPCVVNYVEKLRCITLKGSMVSTLLAYHSQSWKELGHYLPLAFQIIPRKPWYDERKMLLKTLQRKSNSGTLWIAKSSSGCHGEGVEIFCNKGNGAIKMLNYIDSQKEPYLWVVQWYIDNPLLYHRRKFDIRFWVLLCADRYEIYVYKRLVMRMSSIEYSPKSATTTTAVGRLAHITNHCVQAQSSFFEAFEEGNELWRQHLDAVVRHEGKKLLEKGIMHDGANPHLEPSLENTILPQIYHIAVETLLAARKSIPTGRSPYMTPCFQLFGYDFLIDERLRAWLLEINGAPGVADRLLPVLVEDTIEIALTPFFPNTTKSAIRRSRTTYPNEYVRVYP